MSTVATNSGVTTPFKRLRSASSSDENDGNVKRTRRPTYFYILAPESSEKDSSDSEESVYSIQARSTDIAKDTSDTSTDTSVIEYDVVSFSDEPVYPFPSKDSTSSPESSSGQRDTGERVLAHPQPRVHKDLLSGIPLKTVDEDLAHGTKNTLGKFKQCSLDNKIKLWHDCWMLEDVVRQSENGHTIFVSSDSSGICERLSATSESGKVCPRTRMYLFSSCILCGQKYPPTPYPYCISCYKIKKNFFPPRPKRKMKSLKNHQSKDSGVELSENLTDFLDPPRVQNLLDQADVSENKEMCGTCLVKPKDGGYAHKNVMHIYSCYNCSLRILKRTGKCPICNSRVNKVYKLITL